MSGSTRNGKCNVCGKRRVEHLPDAEGLRLLCPGGTGTVFRWTRSVGRLSASFSADEIKLLDAAVAQAMGGPAKISPTNPSLRSLRQKTIAMRNKVTGRETE